MSALSVGVPARTLRVASSAIPVVLGHPALEPVRLTGHESVNRLFSYELLLKTLDGLNLSASSAAEFDLDAFIGREIQCRIELDGSGPFLPGAVGPKSQAAHFPIFDVPQRHAPDASMGAQLRNVPIASAEVYYGETDKTRPPGVPPGFIPTFDQIKADAQSLGHNVASEEDLDRLLAQLTERDHD